MKRVAAVALLMVTAQAATAATPLPSHVYAPYFETWTTDSLTAVAQQSGTGYFALAFLETLSKTSCTLAWNGNRGDVVAKGRYLTDIASLRLLGGDVILSFGGWSADQAGTELADSCKDVKAIAAAYEDVITRYDVTRLDMDIEGRSLRRTAAIDRRNKALKLVQDWAASQGRTFQVSYTLPTSASGIRPPAVAVLRNAVANRTRVDVVNVMAFDYYDGITTDMGTAAIGAANGTATRLRKLGLSAKIGITLMPGVDDTPRKREKTTLAHAQQVYDYARANNVDTLAIWSAQRAQNNPGFTQILAPFTGS